MSIQRSHQNLLTNYNKINYNDINDNTVVGILNTLKTKKGELISDNYKASIYNTLKKFQLVNKSPKVLHLKRHRRFTPTFTDLGLINVLRLVYSYHPIKSDDSHLASWVVKCVLLITSSYMTIKQLFKLNEADLAQVVVDQSGSLAVDNEQVRIHQELFRMKLGQNVYIKNEGGLAIPYKSSTINSKLKALYSSINLNESSPKHLGLQAFRRLNKDTIYQNIVTTHHGNPT